MPKSKHDLQERIKVLEQRLSLRETALTIEVEAVRQLTESCAEYRRMIDQRDVAARALISAVASLPSPYKLSEQVQHLESAMGDDS